MTADATVDAQERADLIETLDEHRGFLRYTVRDITDAQARQRTTASELTLAGIIKHVAEVEGHWVDFIMHGPGSEQMNEETIAEHQATFIPTDDETLAVLLDRYDEVAKRTDKLVRTIPSLDDSQPLPQAPWFEPGARRTARRTLMHIVAETSQHSGHADIIRESLDGQKTMG